MVFPDLGRKILISGSRRYFLLPLLLTVLFLPPLHGGTPQTLADADWFERELGAGVVWRHYLFDNLFGSKQSISYIEADLANPNVDVEFPYLASSRQKVSAMVPGQFPASKAAINGTYFNTGASGGHLTYLRINGTAIPPGGTLFSPWGYEGAVALNALGAASIKQIPAGGWGNNITDPDILACGPLVMVNGTVPSAALAAIGAHCTSRHPRSAVGITLSNRLILLTADGRTEMAAGLTCEELGQVMEQLGCDDALNLDGGGSTTLWGAGEQYAGVLNYPSDNGAYDHLGERSCSNAISVTSTAPTPQMWDARLTGKIFSRFMENGSSQTVSLVYQNVGTGTWTSADTKVVVARPETRTSVFYEADNWHSVAQPAVMESATVAPGETTTFTFVLQSPVLAANAVFDEHFMLVRTGTGRIGPADSEAWMKIGVQIPVAAEETFIVESRAGGQNAAWYSDSGMADTSVNCTATSCTANIGMRYGSTFRSVAGNKRATVAPNFPEDAFYNVYVAWGGGSSRRSPVTYHIMRPGTTFTLQLDQTLTSNTWVQLGNAPFLFEKGYNGSVVMTNEDIDVSGNMFAGAVKFEYVPAEAPEKSYQVEHLASSAAPVIDGVATPGEWNAASPAASGFVRHDAPLTAAGEDGSFKMVFDNSHLYILFQMPDIYLPAFPIPPNPYGYADLGLDKINFFLTPRGVNNPRFYRLVFSPNPTNNTCYVWSQATIAKTTSALVGTDWYQRGGASYSYNGSNLTIEYKIPWYEFDYPGIEVSGSPAGGDVWGVQPCISNQLTAGSSEFVNWEPDGSPTYVFGEPFGMLQFNKNTSAVKDWSIY